MMKAIPQPALPLIKTGIAEMVWPSVPSGIAAALIAQLYQLEQSQWLSRQALLERQLLQLAPLTSHASRHSPFYRQLFDQFAFEASDPWSEERLMRLPLLTRQTLIEQSASIDCSVVPKAHEPSASVHTSGSTGQIVEVKRTALNKLMWMALTLRDHFWHQRDFSQSAAFIRANVKAQDDDAVARKEGWGSPLSLLFETGPAYRQPESLGVREQAAWLLRRDPRYLLIYPTNLNALLDEFVRMGRFPSNLKEVRTIGETFSAGLKARCENDFALKTVDVYSAQEVGVIALQCPVSGLYHVQAESLIVEVLNDEGTPCKEGEIGRVVVTDLHNFATPLIRYEIRDYAEVGGACPCGRGLPTLKRIVGRQRNMVTLPDGSRHWPTVGIRAFREIAPIRQFQAVQHSVDAVEMKLVVDAPLTGEQEKLLRTVIQSALGYPFTLRFSYHEAELPKTQGGKFEEFISLV
jgi:phenylacetate-CoA ligase